MTEARSRRGRGSAEVGDRSGMRQTWSASRVHWNHRRHQTSEIKKEILLNMASIEQAPSERDRKKERSKDRKRNREKERDRDKR